MEDPPDFVQNPASVSEGGNEVNQPDAERRRRTAAEASPPLVAIIGRVNVGKSTLFNRLARQRRALVEDRPGVTRDRVVAQVQLEGREVLLVDTGGLDPAAEHGIPAAVKAQVRQAIEDAAVILFVVDARDGLLPLDQEIARLLREAERAVILTVNKVDGPPQELGTVEFHALGFGEGVPVSAEHRRGMADLELAIAQRLPERTEAPLETPDLAVRVAIVGRPNVGKSSLVNRLAGEERAIVSEEPGTTRDPTDVRLDVEGRPVVLTDTAGLRRAGRRENRLERGSAWMALRSIEQAEVAVLLVDAVDGITEQDARIARLALDRGRPLVVALNKWDAVDPAQRGPEIDKELDRRLHFIPERVVFRVSARTGSGLKRLLPGALRVLEQATPEVPTSQINRALEEAIERNQPPMGGRRRLRILYATQVSRHPFTVLIFVNDPKLMPENYRRYLERSLRKRFNIRAAPVRIRLRARREEKPR